MKKYIGIIAVLALLYSCSTYTVTPESFKKQFATVDSTSLKDVTINNPMTYSTIKYKANKISYVEVVDKNGKKDVLQNSPSLEMRVTLANGKRKIVYFDTAYLQNDTLIGTASRFMPWITRKIPMDSITKIEIQEGGKKYSYQ